MATSVTEEEPFLDEVAEEYLVNFLQHKFSTKNIKYELSSATQKGDNYLGVVYRIKVTTFNISVKNNSETFQLIVKVPPQNLFRRKQFFARPSFEREALAYDEFLPLIKELQEEYLIGTPFDAYPVCYGTLLEEMHEAILMEDLSVRGCHMFDRFKEIDSTHAALIMHTCGKLHATSFALKHKYPNKISKFQQLRDVVVDRNDDIMLAYYEELIKRALNSLNSKGDIKYKNVFSNFFQQQKYHDRLRYLLDGKIAEPYSIVCHGDCWNNNILFQYKDEQPIKAFLIDWQILRYASPITDIMYYLFTSTTGEFRKNHYNEMLDIYYQGLSTHLKSFGLSAEDLFPHEIFKQELKKYGAVGLIFALVVLPVVLLKPDDVPSLDEIGERIENGCNIEQVQNDFLGGMNENEYNKRIRDVIIDMVELDYIK